MLNGIVGEAALAAPLAHWLVSLGVSQAYASFGIGVGTPVSMLALNRPEVLYCIGANGVSGARGTPLHPLGSVDDHVYVLEDAGIQALIFDPIFAERAEALGERVPSLQLLSLGVCDVGEDLIERAMGFTPQPLVTPDVDAEDLGGLVYTGGTTGKPKGVMSTYRSGAAMTAIQMAEWEWPEELRFLICTPLSHAGAAFFIPTLLRGGSLVVIPYFTPDSFPTRRSSDLRHIRRRRRRYIGGLRGRHVRRRCSGHIRGLCGGSRRGRGQIGRASCRERVWSSV